MLRRWMYLQHLFLLALWSNCFRLPTVTSALPSPRSYHPSTGTRSHDKSLRLLRRGVRNDFLDSNPLLQLHLNIALTVRGGGSGTSTDLEDNNDGAEPGFLVVQLRSIANSLWKSSKGTPFHGVVRGLIASTERIVGVRLRPIAPKTAKKKTTKASQKSSTTKKATTQSTINDSQSSSINLKKGLKKSTGTSKKKASSSSNAWVAKEMKTSSPNYRIQRELKAFLTDPPPNLRVKVSGKNIRVWIVTMEGANNTIYEGETFKLRIAFPAQYPQVPPSVYFLPPHIPVHEHVYTNGDICLSLLGKDWRPTMTAQSIAMSILSILSSARSKSLPMDNARHAQNRPGQYQKDWVYHDDSC